MIKIFSIKNSPDKKHRIWTIFGFKFKFSKEKKENRNYELIILKEENECLLKNYQNFTSKNINKKVYLLNDTRRDKNHIGCELVVKNIYQLCKDFNMSIIYSDSAYPCNNQDMTLYSNILKDCDIVIFNGEGTLHDSAGINMFEKCKIAKKMGKSVFLINTVWQNNKKTEKYLELFDLIACRESLSYQEIPIRYRNKTIIVPDLTFYNKLIVRDKNTKIIFTDSVIPEVSKILKNLAKIHNADFYYLYNNNEEDSKYLSEDIVANLTEDSIIVTGRFHALTLGIKYGIKTLAIPSNTHKIEGLLKDVSAEELLITKYDCINEKLKEILRSNIDINFSLYCDNANIKIRELFKYISEQ
jgi:hypothetical protein